MCTGNVGQQLEREVRPSSPNLRGDNTAMIRVPRGLKCSGRKLLEGREGRGSDPTFGQVRTLEEEGALVEKSNRIKRHFSMADRGTPLLEPGSHGAGAGEGRPLPFLRNFLQLWVAAAARLPLLVGRGRGGAERCPAPSTASRAAKRPPTCRFGPQVPAAASAAQQGAQGQAAECVVGREAL